MDCETVKTNKFVHKTQLQNSNKKQDPPNLLQHKNGKKWYEPDIPVTSPSINYTKHYKKYDYKSASQNLYQKVIAASVNSTQQIIRGSQITSTSLPLLSS